MDEQTKAVLDEFTTYIATELQKYKHLQSLRVAKWSLKDFRVTLKIFNDEKPGELYFDIREIKENRGHFGHLLSNALDQLKNNHLISS